MEKSELKAKEAEVPAGGDEAKAGAKAVSENYFADFNFEELKVNVNQMLKSGVHFGHRKSKKHPNMEKYIWTTRNGVSIIDLQLTADKLEEAMEFLRSIAASGKKILFVGTKKQAKKILKSAAERCKMPYVQERWLGGTFTNFSVIAKRAKYLRDSLAAMEKGEFNKYTKFEQLKKKEELANLELRMGGLKNMEEFPGAVLVLDAKENFSVIKESKKVGVPVVALADTNVDTKGIDYPVPANDDAVSSIKLMLAYFVKAIIIK